MSDDQKEKVLTKAEWDEIFSDINSLDKESIQFFFKQAEMQLMSLVQITENFRNRALNILTFLVPVLLAILGVIYTYLQNIPIVFSLMIAYILLSVCAYYCLKILNTRQSMFLGASPSRMVDMKWLKSIEDNQIDNITLNECQNYDGKINLRIQENKKLGGVFKSVVYLLLATPFISFFGFVYIVLIKYILAVFVIPFL